MAQKPGSKSQGSKLKTSSKPKTNKRRDGVDTPIALAWVWSEFKGEFPQSEDEKQRLIQLKNNFKRASKPALTPNETDKTQKVAQNLARIKHSKLIHKSNFFDLVKNKNEIQIALIGFAALFLFLVIYSFGWKDTPTNNASRTTPIQTEAKDKLAHNPDASSIIETKKEADISRLKIEEKPLEHIANAEADQAPSSHSEPQQINRESLSQSPPQAAQVPEVIKAISSSSADPIASGSEKNLIDYLLTAQDLLNKALKENPNAGIEEALDKIDQLRFFFVQEAIDLLEQSQIQQQEVKETINQLKIANIRPDITQKDSKDSSNHKDAGIMITEQNSILLLGALPLAALALLFIIYLLSGKKSVSASIPEEQPIESAMKNSFLQALNNPEFSHDQIVDLVHSLRSMQNSAPEDQQNNTELLLEKNLLPQDAGRFYIFRHQIIRAALLLASLFLGVFFPVIAFCLIIIVALLIF
ncbi:MAG: hypothetical protein ACKOEW_04030, partial [Methylocystis sp.]